MCRRARAEVDPRDLPGAPVRDPEALADEGDALGVGPGLDAAEIAEVVLAEPVDEPVGTLGAQTYPPPTARSLRYPSRCAV